MSLWIVNTHSFTRPCHSSHSTCAPQPARLFVIFQCCGAHLPCNEVFIVTIWSCYHPQLHGPLHLFTSHNVKQLLTISPFYALSKLHFTWTATLLFPRNINQPYVWALCVIMAVLRLFHLWNTTVMKGVTADNEFVSIIKQVPELDLASKLFIH